MKNALVFSAFLLSVLTVNATFDVTWIPEINTKFHDSTPFVTPDGQTMYFASGRQGTMGLHDIYKATLSGGLWSNITNITELNTTENESAPWVVGNYMYFGTTRWGGTYHLARATYDNGVWGNIVPLPGLPQVGDDLGCSVTADGMTMYFVSTRYSPQGKSDIFKAINIGGNWGNVTNIGPPVNSEDYEGGPDISPDGTILHFDRMQANGYWDIYVSYWNGSSWSEPVKLPNPINSYPWQDETSCYRPEQHNLWFVTDRPPSLGGHDIWKASNYNVGIEPTTLGRIKASFMNQKARCSQALD